MIPIGNVNLMLVLRTVISRFGIKTLMRKRYAKKPTGEIRSCCSLLISSSPHFSSALRVSGRVRALHRKSLTHLQLTSFRKMSGEITTESAAGVSGEPQARHVVYCGGADLKLRRCPLLILETLSLHPAS